MNTGIRSRILTWLVVAVIPLLGVALLSATVIEDRLVQRAESDLANLRRLEVARIDQELELFARDGARLAEAAHSVIFTSSNSFQTASSDDAVVGVDQPDDMTEAMNLGALGVRTTVLEARLVDLDGNVIDESFGFGWEPTIPGLVPSALETGTARFGRAYQATAGDARVGWVTPVSAPNGQVVGGLLVEFSLQSITEALAANTAFGASSETYIAQLDGRDQIQFLSQLRFERDAAFRTLRASAEGSAIDSAIDIAFELDNPAVTIVDDYRGVSSLVAVDQIEATGWGLVTKIDADEALGLSRSIRAMVLVGLLIAICVLLLGWFVVLSPLIRRILRTANAAQGMAEGDFTSKIDDWGTDEIAEVARSIDYLAAELHADIEKRNEVERRLRHQATHDELTDLYNRQHMTELIQKALRHDGNHSVTVLFIDLDDFKLTNDLWGHAVGDEVLAAFAQRLCGLISEGATVSRWGGDEFTAMLHNVDDIEISQVLRRLQALFDRPVQTSVGPHLISCSVGVATATSRGDFDTLLHDADSKMFEAKQANRKSRMIDPDTARLVERALTEGRFEAFYQPIVSLQSDSETRIEGAEVLVRLRAGDGRLLTPEDFLPQVLSHRYAREIDRTMVEVAFADLATWRGGNLVSRNFMLALNLSPASMRDPQLPAMLREVAAQHKIEPKVVLLEISEDADDLDPIVLAELRSFGFRIAIDDLGMKRSNLDRMLDTGAAVAKLHRRWHGEPAVLESLVQACLRQDVMVIASGVETMDQLATLFGLGVRYCQGFLLSRPQSQRDFSTLLGSGQPAVSTLSRDVVELAAGSHPMAFDATTPLDPSSLN